MNQNQLNARVLPGKASYLSSTHVDHGGIVQKDIAAYLGITPVFVSVLRKRL